MPARVLFYIQRNLHLPFLEPVQEQLVRLRPDVETAFCAPSFIPPKNGLPGWGLEEEEVARLRSRARFVRTVEEFCPDVTVFADACTNVAHCGKRVFVGHGIISKGGFYTDNELVRRENLADLICVPGPWHKQILEKNVFSPIEVTGFIKSDRLFGAQACTRDAFCRQYSIPPDVTIILYAPTFNAELSAIPCLGEQIAAVCAAPHRYLLIKLHTMTDTVLVEMHRRLAAGHPRIRCIEDIDVTPAMAAADILISDVSSVLVEFMALDRPVIAVNNPRQQEYEGYRPDDIEYRVRDACLQVETVPELLAAVAQAERCPAALSSRRRVYAEALCFGRDGRAAERVAQAVIALHDDRLAVRGPRLHCAVLYQAGTGQGTADLLLSLGDLLMSQHDVTLDIVVWGCEAPADLQVEAVKAWLPAAMDCHEALCRLLQHSSAPYLVLLVGDLVLPERGLTFLHNHFRWHPATAVVRALTARDNYPLLIQTIYPESTNVPVEQVAALLLAVLMGRSVEMEQGADGCCMVGRDLVSSMVTSRHNNGVPLAELVRQQAVLAGQACRLALDLFVSKRAPLLPDTALLEQLVYAYRCRPDDLRVLHQLLALLLRFNQHDDAAMLWRRTAEQAVRLTPVWGWLSRGQDDLTVA